MAKRTWSYTLVTTLLIAGLAACGGSGGGGGGGGGGIPTASNAAITPPPTDPIAITAAGGTPSAANQSIAANASLASEGAFNNVGDQASGLVGVQAADGATRETLAAIVRRHAEMIKDHQTTVTGALQVVDVRNCAGGGTDTFAADNATQNATEVFVNCNDGGIVKHGTLSSSNVGVFENLGPTVGSPYVMSVSATLTIDLSVAQAPAPTVVSQGAFTFSVTINGNMQANGTGGVQPGPATSVQISMIGQSLLSSNGTERELLSNFAITLIDTVNTSTSTLGGSYTYASTTIGGSVLVTTSTVLTFQAGAKHPSSGDVQITSSASPGKIVLHVINSVDGVNVDVYADAAGGVTNTIPLTWAQVDAL
jgi:hypothetical protein